MTDHAELDMATLDMLKEIMEDGFAELVDTFVTDFQTRLVAMQEGLAAGDADVVRREAHSMKGSSGNLGATGLAALLLEVETKGRECDLTGVASLVVFIEAAYKAVSEKLLAMIKS